MRLIDADTLDEEIMHFFMTITGNPKPTTVVDECKSSFRRLIDEQPTAYDVDKVVEQLEEERDYCYKEMEKEKEKTDYFSEHIFEEHHNQGMAYNKAVEIVKSGRKD